MRTLLLFDVDGVLIHPKGYKIALQATVEYFAEQMGLTPVELTFNEIAIYEACGMTNEWDSAAFSVGAILINAIASRNNLIKNNLPDTCSAIQNNKITIPRPDFIKLAHKVTQLNQQHEAPTTICCDVLKSHAHSDLHALLDTLFIDIYSLDTPTTLIQQIHTLGSQSFTKTYGKTALLDRESYLIKYDTALLEPTYQQALLDWNQNPDHGFVIYTARPSLPPVGISEDLIGYAPEADLAVELLGFSDDIPLIASGRMKWLARQHNREAAEYIKPSPVQALAAIGAALSGNEIEGLNAAASLFEQNQLLPPLTLLSDQPTQVIVFDDSIGGLKATQLAGERLRAAGLDIQVEAIGVAPEESKRTALNKVANHVVNNINEGLQNIL